MAGTPSSSRGPGDTDVVGARIGAQLIDMVAMFVILFLFVLVGVSAVGGGEGSSGVAILIFLVVGLGYGTVLEGAYGKTLGKMVTNVRVVGPRGREIGYEEAFVRNVPALFGGWLTWLVGVAAIAVDDQNQRLFDRPAGTYVVRDAEGGPELTDEQQREFTR